MKMIDYNALILSFLFGLTSPATELSLEDLDSPHFQARMRATESLIKNGEPYLPRIMVAASVLGMNLERTRRLDELVERVGRNYAANSYKWFTKKWDKEWELADILLGTSWPSIYALWWQDGCDHDIAWRMFYKYDNRANYGGQVINDRSYYFYYYGVRTNMSSCIDLNDWERLATKVWMIEELDKGTSVLTLSLVLARMRAIEKRHILGLWEWQVSIYRSTTYWKEKRQK